jgi:hypothetical protein
MKIKRIKKLKVNSFTFTVKWTDKHDGGSFTYDANNRHIEIGVKGNNTDSIFHIINHELWEIVAIEAGVRLNRPDCASDYIFVYDHRQHELICNMHAALLSQFIE